MKNEPALRVSGSAGSSTMPLPRRSRSTASRAPASGTRSPSAAPRTRASSAYRTGADRGSRASRKVTSSTTNRPAWPPSLNTLVR